MDANLSPTESIFVFGKSVGETSLIGAALDGSELFRYTVVVTHPLSEIRRSLSRRFPSEAISVESSRGSVLVGGAVSSEAVRANVIRTIEASIPGSTILDQITVSSSNLIRLQVRLLEINRSKAQNFGINLTGFLVNNGDVSVNSFNTTGQSSLNATVSPLIANGVATIVQETALSTVFGEEAQFSLGGEIPIPAFLSGGGNGENENGNFGLDFKFIGTDLKFTPTQAPGNKLRIAIESSISSAQQGSSVVNGNTFPNISQRSFNTSVELEDSQSFVIAGLSKDETIAALRDSNGGFASSIANIFSRDRLSSSNQELVVIVTPILSGLQQESVEAKLIDRPSNLEFILSRGPKGAGKVSGNIKNLPDIAGFEY
jgi:pilus assembly protein CpaC